MGDSPREKIFQVRGMHCASCELLIEKRLIDLLGVKAVEASTSRGEVVVEYEGDAPGAHKLSHLFEKEHYVFSDHPGETRTENDNLGINTLMIVVLVVMGFLIFSGLGLTSLVNVNNNSSLLMFLVLGVVAGLSTCAALVGGLVLSMSKQWLELYSDKHSTLEKLQPHLLFNTGRVASYAFFGGLLGLLGSKLQISLGFTSFLIVVVSVLMIFLGLQMLGVRYFQKFQFTMPKAITRFAADERNFKGRQMPFLMGAMTFLLPCGFTITAQSLALLSGNIWQGASVMLAFVLGTTPSLLAIGLSSVKFSENQKLAPLFLKGAGALVLFFAFYNLNNQFNVLGFPSMSDLKLKTSTYSQSKAEEGLATLVAGKQILKMDASAAGYKPNYFKVRVGVPVRWEITDRGTSGCTNAVISRSLFEGQIDLALGQVSVKEFTPGKPGRYKFSCWMGMISGTIEVVGEGEAASATVGNTNLVQNGQNDIEVPSGVSGCGCGGGQQNSSKRGEKL